MSRNAVSKTWLKRKWGLIPVFLVLLLAGAFGIYVSDYSHTEDAALSFMQSDETVTVVKTGYGWLFDGPSQDRALIFYPGGKVEESAYAPLLHTLAAQGIDVCLVRMPFRLAVLNGNAAENVLKAHDYAEWYIGGHSLGGVMAAGCAADHGDVFSGVILLASFPIRKLPDHLTEILLIGSEDRVIDWEKVKRGQAYAPARYTEHIIAGGNHAQFGCYGTQRGDGAAQISAEEQMRETVRVILENLPLPDNQEKENRMIQDDTEELGGKSHVRTESGRPLIAAY